jgi:hypothetical protein
VAGARDGGSLGFEIPPNVVREVARARPEAGDVRERFRREQPWLSAAVVERMGGRGELAAELAHSLGAALWSMYDRSLEALRGTHLEVIEAGRVETFLPVASELLARLGEGRPGEEFDAEWLAELPRGAQPHLMGFLIGALRAARLRLSGAEILGAATALFALAGALEAAASKAWTGGGGEPS